ncbi:MAG: histidinol-phosphate aminotransferase family protein [Gemmatimonadaceae bacterium]|nr:histidinol-phosphate aminotransferase family protein [Gemmatimonadaceae bacterium]MCW5827018.1 histidinol-phosphate aminotransferase family protein [Gemmatimonadaceae bacterium]
MTTTREDLAAVPLYAPQPLAGVDLDLRDNVNLWGTPPAALAAVRAVELADLREYPNGSASTLGRLVAERVGVGTEQVVLGCGSDDVIDAWLRAVGSSGDIVAHADPSFSMVPTFARLNRLRPIGVPLTADGPMDVDALLATGAPLIYVCSPNNPTGTVTPRAELLRLFDRAPGAVLLDEAYAEFSDAHDLRAEAARRPNVLVTRTFSKAWGLAGLRVGYGVGSAALVAAVTKARGPYKVNAMAERAAAAALRADVTWVEDAAGEAREVRERFADGLRGRKGVTVWPSEGNFVFLQVDGRAADVAERFRAGGIGVRAFTGLTGIGDAVRIGVAPWPQMARALRVAQEIWP